VTAAVLLLVGMATGRPLARSDISGPGEVVDSVKDDQDGDQCTVLKPLTCGLIAPTDATPRVLVT
jgi:hypothetical protein